MKSRKIFWIIYIWPQMSLASHKFAIIRLHISLETFCIAIGKCLVQMQWKCLRDVVLFFPKTWWLGDVSSGRSEQIKSNSEFVEISNLFLVKHRLVTVNFSNFAYLWLEIFFVWYFSRQIKFYHYKYCFIYVR